MKIITTVAGVRSQVQHWRQAGERVALVPTMGNLHAGHISLLASARQRAAHIVVSVFVNPLQFGPQEDYARYPRTPEDDERLLTEANCDALFRPPVEEVYSQGGTQSTTVAVRGLNHILCGEFRPGHFDGVATVVAKLFGIVQPDVAVFGEKDFQQFLVIQRMTRELAIPVEVLGAPTVRAADGLALSSRNRYLSAEQRRKAPAIYAALRAAQQRLLSEGVSASAVIEQEGRSTLLAAGFQPDYFSVRDAEDLAAPRERTRECVVLTAARLGRSRLIDNLRVELQA